MVYTKELLILVLLVFNLVHHRSKFQVVLMSRPRRLRKYHHQQKRLPLNVEQNTSNAIQTKEISNTAKLGLEEVIYKAIMSVEATRTIADRIIIINDIAFKTNILALNATVEADRAGKHGRGFAVAVAEVRKLAEISRKAADEIIGNSKNSLQYAEEADIKLETMLPIVVRTRQLVEEIAAESSEQNSAITQVNASILELSNVIQQNSASAEE